MQDRAVPAEETRKLVHQALLDLRQARESGDIRRSQRAESRMNALLDHLADAPRVRSAVS